MARLVVADAGVQRLARTRQLAAGVEAQQVLADVHGVGGDELGVEIFGQLDVLFAEHESGGRLGADDRVAVAHGVGQHAQVRQGLVAGMIDVADDQGRHARAALPRGHVDVDLGVMEHRDDGLGQLLVVVVGEDVDEIDDPRARQLGARLVEPQPGRPAGERRPPHTRQQPVPRDAQQPIQQPARPCAAPARSWSGSETGCPAAPRARSARRSSRRAAGRASRRRPPWPRASSSRRRRPRDTRSGTACNECRDRHAPSIHRRPRAADRLAAGEHADQVGLRPGRGRLLPRGSEARAHPRRRLERSGRSRSRGRPTPSRPSPGRASSGRARWPGRPWTGRHRPSGRRRS